ncbi:MAG: BTAD domain-containing putative transcriptional regulator [Gemmatimonadota bacterium]
MLQLKTFGGLWLTGDDGRLAGQEGLRRQLLLLALVAEAGERGISRDRAIAFFWPEGDEEKGRRSLNQLRYTLRRQLGVDPLVGTRTLRADPAHLGSDVAEFAAAIDAGNADRAAALHAGHFLEGIFAEGSAELDALIEERRTSLKRALEAVLVVAARAAAARGDHLAAIGYRQRLVKLDPLSTRYAIGLMTALAELDDGSGALVVAATHEAAVRRELETAPDASVAALVAEIRGGTRTPRPAAPLPDSAPRAAHWRSDLPTPAVISVLGASLNPPLRRGYRGWYIGLGAGLVIVLGLLVSFHRPAPHLDLDQVLVVPLENRTGDSTLSSVGAMAADWITQGIVDEGVAPTVSPLSALAAVRGADSARQGNPRADRLRTLAEESGAGLVVTGAYDRVGDSLTFEVRLNDPLTGRVVAALPATRSGLTDPSAALMELRQRVVGALRVHQNPVATDPTGQRASHPPIPAAYRAFLAAQAVNAEYHYEEANQLYRQAYELDTTFLTPIPWIASNYLIMGDFVRADSVLQAMQPRESRMQAADRLSLEKTRNELSGDRMAALHTSEALRRIMPGAEADVFLGMDLLRVNRVREALPVLRGVNPNRGWIKSWNGYWNLLSAAYHMNGDYHAALEVARQGRRQVPTLSDALANEVAQRVALGQITEANREVAQWLSGSRTLDRGVRAALGRTGLEMRAHGHPDEGRLFAVEALGTLRALGHPDSNAADRLLLLALLCQAERWPEAESLARAVDLANPTDPDGQGYLGISAARLGDTLTAHAAERALDTRPYPYSEGRPLMWQARIAAVQHDPERAMALIQAALRAGYGDFLVLHRIQEFESLQKYPPFVALLKPAG